jgi:hypothetical protein
VAEKRRLVLVRPPSEPTEIKELIGMARARALNAGMLVKSYRADSGRLVGVAPERPVLLLKPHDARQLYETLHTERVLVLAFNAVWVRRNPQRAPPELRAALPLSAFVAHKCVYQLTMDAQGLTAAFTEYDIWLQARSCTGDGDPRVLPLHVFETSGDWSGLGTRPIDRRFAATYGPPHKRIDDGGKAWTRPPPGAFHGGGSIVVAGRALTVGLHWDVSTKSRRARVYTTHEVWELRRRTGYLNVHPNAYIRKARRSTARQIWRAT